MAVTNSSRKSLYSPLWISRSAVKIKHVPRALRLILPFLGLLGGTACQPYSADLSEPSGPIRFITEDPETFFNAQTSIPWQRETLQIWSLRDPHEVKKWRIIGADRLSEVSRSGLRVNSSGYRIKLVRNVTIDASKTPILAFELRGFLKGQLILEWSDGEQPWQQRRRLILRAEETNATSQYRFLVGEQRTWRGQIKRLRLTLLGPEKHTLELRSMTAERLSYSADILDRGALGPWKLDIDDEVRNVFLGVDSLPVEFPVTVEPEQMLSFGFALQETCPGPVEWIASFLPQDPSDAEKQTLFQHRADPGSPQAAVWHDREIDLTPWQGLQGTLSFETRYDSFSPLAGAAFWSNPEIRPAEARQAATKPSQLNVLFISIDTLRADHLSLYGYERQTSPEIEALARQGAVIFENTVAPSSTTKISHASIFTGIHPHRHGVQHELVRGELDLLAERLRAQGYATTAFTGGGRMHPLVGFSQGFDRYRYFSGDVFKELEHNLERALTFLDDRPVQPFFLFFHTYETHTPYREREPYFSKFGGRPTDGRLTSKRVADPENGQPLGWALKLEGPGRVEITDLSPDEVTRLAIDRYDSSIAYTDQAIGRLIDGLEAAGLLETTLIVLTSDHGEAFGEGGHFLHGSLDDANLMVPLIFVDPRFPRGIVRVERQVRSVDIVPTLLELLDLPVPSNIDGVSLRPLIENPRAEFPDEAWSYASNTDHGLALRLSNRLKYIFNDSLLPQASQPEKLYDLRRDPREAEDLTATLDTSPLRARAAEELENNLPGLKVELANPTESPFSVSLRGVAIMASRVGSWTIPPGRVQDFTGGRLEVEVRPEDRYSLLIDAASSHAFDLAVRDSQGSCGIPDCAANDLRLGQGESFVLVKKGGVWSNPPTGGVQGAEIRLAWRGNVSEAKTDPTSADQELREQLRTLGYID